MEYFQNFDNLLKDTKKNGWEVFLTVSHNNDDGRLLVSLRDGVREQLTDLMRQSIVESIDDFLKEKQKVNT